MQCGLVRLGNATTTPCLQMYPIPIPAPTKLADTAPWDVDLAGIPVSDHRYMVSHGAHQNGKSASCTELFPKTVECAMVSVCPSPPAEGAHAGIVSICTMRMR